MLFRSDLDIPGYVYIGGPVNQNNISLLHTNDWSCDNTLKLNDDISLSSSKQIMQRFQNNDLHRFNCFSGTRKINL